MSRDPVDGGAASNGPVAVVTGAASGIGRATATALAVRGHRVALLDRDGPGASALARALTDQGTDARAYVCDVTDTADVEAAVSDVGRRWGRIDAVAACAGIEVLGDVASLSDQAWNRALDVNAGGVLRLARATVPFLVETRGAFVAVASDAGVTGAQGYAAYAASKHAVVGLVRCMALDHGPAGVRSNVVCPAFVETPMAERIFADSDPGERDFYRRAVPLGRFARPEEVASAIVHLLSAEASYSNGMVYRVDGGSTAGYYVGNAAG
ncbi:SDR family NAD(P)-dependent oxidoreductase [Modestobacter sp. I12A-02662]|uniref:SDR family NAD(P)-dependent oxidoreductase n=1 Tax=Modestobacter sp. I12A-02662 TaxID=1730496 RepID=UPI0034DDE7BF